MLRDFGALMWRKHLFGKRVYFECPMCGHFTTKLAIQCPHCKNMLKGVKFHGSENLRQMQATYKESNVQ